MSFEFVVGASALVRSWRFSAKERGTTFWESFVLSGEIGQVARRELRGQPKIN